MIVPSGRYRVYATRGPEYSVTEANVEPRPGRPVTLEIEKPKRMVGLPGWVAADLHVHTAMSDDTSTLPESQVQLFVIDGLAHVDFRPKAHDVPQLLGAMEALLASRKPLPGDER